MNRVVTILGVVLFLSVLSLPASEAAAQVYVGGPVPVTVYRAPAVYGAPVYGAPVATYYRAPVARYYRAPVTVYRAPVTAYYAPAPVYAAPAPVTSYYAPTMVAAPVYYGYRPYYVPGQPVRNVLRATFP
jgi:hypothetical protein